MGRGSQALSSNHPRTAGGNPPLSPSAQNWTTCQWPELVPTYPHPGPTPLVLVSLSLSFLHPLVLSSPSTATTYLPTPIREVLSLSFYTLPSLVLRIYLRAASVLYAILHFHPFSCSIIIVRVFSSHNSPRSRARRSYSAFVDMPRSYFFFSNCSVDIDTNYDVGKPA